MQILDTEKWKVGNVVYSPSQDKIWLIVSVAAGIGPLVIVEHTKGELQYIVVDSEIGPDDPRDVILLGEL